MTQPILYSFRRCPYAIRARMALHYSQISFEHREVVLANKPAEMLAISPKGTVPVLLIEEGIVLEESLDIMCWALEKSDPDNWLQKDKAQDITSLINSNDHSFKKYLDGYKYPNKSLLTAEVNRSKAGKFLSQLDGLLTQNQFLFGNKPCIADIAIFPFIRQFRGVDIDWFDSSAYKALINWVQHFLNSPVFIDVMSKYKPWAINN